MKKFLSLVLALVMTMSLVTISAGAKDFTDGSKITYKEAVDVVSAVKVVDGYTDGSFNPSATLTRGAAAKIICNLILGPTTAGALVADAAPFKDVPADSTFAGYIAFCSKEGIISGYADGTFKPGNTLTGYAFMKMLLGALGYDKSIEGYEGANWSINVAKRALAIGLDKGLEDDFNGIKPVTREEACLYAFNTLQATMVKYANNSTITVGDIVINSNAKAEDEAQGSYNDNMGKSFLQFAEKYFPDLKKDDAKDAFYRPAVKWTWKKAEVGTYGKKADATFTTKVTGEMLMDIADCDATADGDSYHYYTDGNSSNGSLTVADNDTKLIGGNGVVVEVYVDVATNSNRLVVINPQIGEVKNVDKNKDGERYIEIEDITYQYKTEEFEEDDMVLYAVSDVDGSSAKIQTVESAEKLTGKVTKKVGTKWYIDGTKYEVSNSTGAEIDTGADVDDEVDFYLDQYGYILKLDATAAKDDLTNFALVTAADSNGGGSPTVDTRVVLRSFVDATKSVVSATNSDFDEYYGYIVSTAKKTDGYKLTMESEALQTYTVSTISKNVPKISLSSSKSFLVDDNTVFLYDEYDATKGTHSYSVVTGYQNMKTFANGTSIDIAWAYNAKNEPTSPVVAVAISYVKGTTSSSGNSDVTYFAYDPANSELVVDKAEGTQYYEVAAIRKGVITTLKLDADSTDNMTTYYIDKNVTVDSDGIVSATGSMYDGTDFYSFNQVKSVKNGVITLTDGTAVSYAWATDVAAFEVAKDESEIVKVELTDLSTKANKYDYILVTLNDDGRVDMVIAHKK